MALLPLLQLNSKQTIVLIAVIIQHNFLTVCNFLQNRRLFPLLRPFQHGQFYETSKNS